MLYYWVEGGVHINVLPEEARRVHPISRSWSYRLVLGPVLFCFSASALLSNLIVGLYI